MIVLSTTTTEADVLGGMSLTGVSEREACMVLRLFSLIAQGLNAIPSFRRYRTAIVLGSLGTAAALDAAKVTAGAYDTLSPYLWPVATATALAHESTKKK